MRSGETNSTKAFEAALDELQSLSTDLRGTQDDLEALVIPKARLHTLASGSPGVGRTYFEQSALTAEQADPVVVTPERGRWAETTSMQAWAPATADLRVQESPQSPDASLPEIETPGLRETDGHEFDHPTSSVKVASWRRWWPDVATALIATGVLLVLLAIVTRL